MIRKFKAQDIDNIMKLWLETNISAHAFIKDEYWKNNLDTVKKMMPCATVYIYEENENLQGFIGLIDGHITGIFVSQILQSKGIGKQLLDYVKNINDRLALAVYKKNERASNFYLREGFVITKEQTDENTGEIEFAMEWVQLPLF